jgi:NAD(P)-dependent dehydrogenase (short-subunit alcohol dehydrogenase family)
MKQRVVLVTGASGGIGKATVKLFAEHDYVTYATARHPDKFSELTAFGCQALCIDVTDEQSMTTAAQQIERERGIVDILVNCAGYSQGGPLEELPVTALRDQFETNVFGLLRMSQLVLPGMRKQGWGRIINVSSVAGEVTMPGVGAYAMSKHAVECLTDALRYEVKSFGVDVISIQPGGVATNFGRVEQERFGGSEQGPYAKFRENVIRVLRQGADENTAGILKPEQVARVIWTAASVRRPRTRYKVGPLAKVVPRLRQFLPDRAWDQLMSNMFPMT